MNKETLDELLLKIWNQKEIDLIFELFSEEAIIHSSIGSFQSAKEMYSAVKLWQTAFPDIQVKHRPILQEGDTFVVQWEAEGTHKEEFEGIPAKGNPVKYTGCTIYKCKNNQVVEYWAYVDRHELEKQIRADKGPQ